MEDSFEQSTSVNTLSASNKNNKKVTTVKSSIIGIGWKPQYLPILKKLVHDVHIIVTHTYPFIRYIFIQEIGLNLEEYAVQGFYKEVFLSLLDTKVKNGRKLSSKVNKYRDMIHKYKTSYFRNSSFTQIKITNAQQIASYEATKIQTAYNNALALQFGNKLRITVNKLIGLKHRISQWTSDLKKEGCSEEEIKAKVKSNIIEPATELKLAISSRNIDRVPKEFLDQKTTKHIMDLFSAYPNAYKFKKNFIYYDAVANPRKHLVAYDRLAEICESNEFKSFQCFPLRKTFSYHT